MTEDATRNRMRDIAERANVSIMTVSRVIRDPGRVAPATRERVLAAVREAGYIPNAIAGSRAFQRTSAVAMIVPSMRNSLFANTIQAASEVLSARSFLLMIAASGGSLEEEERLVASFLAQRPSGIILHNTVHTERTHLMLAHAGIPVVETGDLAKHPIDMVVSFSNEAAARAITAFLIGKGYSRIGLVILPAAINDRARRRLKGYKAGLKAAGLPFDARLVIETSEGFRAGAVSLVRLMEGAGDVQAVIFAGEVGIIGALLECQRRNWPVPGRVALAGFDVQEHEIASELTPQLTNVLIRRDMIGTTAARFVLDRLDGAPMSSRALDVGFEIVQGESS